MISLVSASLIAAGAALGAGGAVFVASLDEDGAGRAEPRLIAVMAALGALVGLWAAVGPAPAPALAAALLGWALLLTGAVDARHFWLPDWLTLPLLAAGLAAATVLDRAALTDHLIGAVAGFVVLWGVAALYRRARGREGLGGGDFRLLAAAGAWVGWMGLPSVLLWACAGGLSLTAARVILRRPVSGQDRLPFGAFLAVGIWLTWLYGPLGL